jgi:hypothetical protein
VFNTIRCAKCSSPVQKGSHSCWFCGAAVQWVEPTITTPPAGLQQGPAHSEAIQAVPGLSEPLSSSAIQTSPRPTAEATPRQQPAESKSCPMCRKDIPHTAVKCKYCGAVFDNRVSTSWGPSLGGHVHRDHRGGTVLTMGLLGLFCCALLAPIAVVMGVLDLQAMAQGRMDSEGQGRTIAGLIFGILGLLPLAAWVIALALHR